MAGSASPLLRSSTAPHVHISDDVCPWCEQSIPHDKFEEITARFAAEEQERLALQERELKQQFALERTVADSKAKDEIERVRKETAGTVAQLQEAAKLATEDHARKLEAAAASGKAQAEAEAREKVVQAEAAVAKAGEEKAAVENQLKEQNEANRIQLARAEEKRVADIEATRKAAEAAALQKSAAAIEEARRKAADAEAAKVAAEKDAADKIVAAVAAKTAAEQSLVSANAAHATELTTRVEEARESLSKEMTKALLEKDRINFEDRQKLIEQVADMQRKLDKKTAGEHGEGAELDLYDELKRAFECDNIRRVPKGVNGADIIHEVIENGKVCGKIIYDSKNRDAWQSKFATKLHDDMIAEKADHAVLSTNKFPAGVKQLELYEGVVLACPARVLAIATILRQLMVQIHTLRMSNEQRDEKTAEVYAFITSDHCWQLLNAMQTSVDNLLEVEVTEQKQHQATWQKRGNMLKDMEKTRGKFVHELTRIIGTSDAEE